ncbi:MAG: hypothetical protein Q7T16_00695 [Candidatus Burarchaeum sp.]|nr:hypothetical protein [Candidatus Burarchaeum sp.]MDO8339155.1 hypothetical protein [Candidatus Burarchaeum sp.]
MAVQLKTLVEYKGPGKKVQTTPEATEFRRLPWHLEPADKQRLMDQLDGRLKRLADEIQKCHYIQVLNMWMELEKLSGSELFVGLEITLRGRGGEYKGVEDAAVKVAHILYELVPDLSLEEVVVIVTEIDKADERSIRELNKLVFSNQHEEKKPAETFTKSKEGEYRAPLSKAEWLERMLGSAGSEDGTDLAERMAEIDKKALLSAYSDAVLLKIDSSVKEILRKECGAEHMRTDWPWAFGYFLIEKTLTRKMMSEQGMDTYVPKRA